MTTTISPVENTGCDDLGMGPGFPAATGRGMGYEISRHLRESKGASIPKPKVNPKKFIQTAEGSKTTGKKPKVKKGKKPENLRVAASKGKKGIFGEKYTQPKGNAGKGVRVTESRRQLRFL